MESTPHINPTASIAENMLLPGDPLRAKFIAENFLEDVSQFNAIRGALGFTGKYKKIPVSVMGTGMGMPSMGIYSYELINIYGVKNLIRVGSCGALQDDLKLYDIILALSASTNSNYASQYKLPGTFAPAASWKLLSNAVKAAESLKIKTFVGNILSSDTFYDDNAGATEAWRKMGVLAIEMEAAALYMNAARHGADALCIATVSDHIITHEATTPAEREKSFAGMIEIALETLKF